MTTKSRVLRHLGRETGAGDRITVALGEVDMLRRMRLPLARALTLVAHVVSCGNGDRLADGDLWIIRSDGKRLRRVKHLPRLDLSDPVWLAAAGA